MRSLPPALWLLLPQAVAVTAQEGPRLMQASELATLPQPPADHTIAYGAAKQQVAELRLPKGAGPHPVVIVIHGGCWQTPWAMDHVRGLAAAFTAEGCATWSLEYRRVGDAGGGWPGTLQDVARGADHLRTVASAHRLDLARVVALGHSAGGQLALWLAARRHLPRDSSLWTTAPLPLRGIVSLAGVTDLRAAAAAEVCGDAVPQLLGGAPAQREERVRQSSPIELLPLGVPQRLVCGALDRLVPNDLSRGYEAAARKAGDTVSLELVEGVGHFELVDPASRAWPAVRAAVAALVR
jgi:acetyl esterase/lipase